MQRKRDPLLLLQRCRFLVVTLKLEHHAADMLVILMRYKPTETFLRVTPSQNLNLFVTRAPGVHLAGRSHVQIEGVSARECPPVVIYVIDLAGRK